MVVVSRHLLIYDQLLVVISLLSSSLVDYADRGCRLGASDCRWSHKTDQKGFHFLCHLSLLPLLRIVSIPSLENSLVLPLLGRSRHSESGWERILSWPYIVDVQVFGVTLVMPLRRLAPVHGEDHNKEICS